VIKNLKGSSSRHTRIVGVQFESERRAGGKRQTISEHLGVHPHTKADEARAKAAEIVGRIARGEPIEEPKSAKG